MTSKLTAHQKKLLLEYMKINYRKLEGKFPAAEGSKNKDEIWSDLQVQLNVCGPAKTSTQWQKCWNDMKMHTRKKFRQLTAERQKTGGGIIDPRFELNNDQSEIFDICGVDYFAGDNETNEVGFGVNSTQKHIHKLFNKKSCNRFH